MNNHSQRKRPFFKLAALVTFFCFTSETATAFPGTPPFEKPSQIKTVYLLLNAHASSEAQRQIGRLLKFFQKKGILSVGLEGASDPIDGRLFRSFPEKNALARAAWEMVKEGKLTGAEYFYITAKKLPRFYGLERKEFYLRNREAFVLSTKTAGGIEPLLERVERSLRKEENGSLSPRLRRFLVLDRRFKIKAIGFGEYFSLLVEFARESRLSLVDFPNLYLLSRVLSKSKRAISAPLNEGIHKGLFGEELEALTEKIYGRLTQSKAEKNLIDRIQNFERFKSLLRLELTAKDWNRIRQRGGGDQFFATFGLSKEGVLALEEAREHALRFYALAGRRDRIFAGKILRELSQGKIKATVAVVGGFHETGLGERLERAGVTVVPVLPRLGNHIDDIPYRDRLASTLDIKLVISSIVSLREKKRFKTQLFRRAKSLSRSEARGDQSQRLASSRGEVGLGIKRNMRGELIYALIGLSGMGVAIVFDRMSLLLPSFALTYFGITQLLFWKTRVSHFRALNQSLKKSFVQVFNAIRILSIPVLIAAYFYSFVLMWLLPKVIGLDYGISFGVSIIFTALYSIELNYHFSGSGPPGLTSIGKELRKLNKRLNSRPRSEVRRPNRPAPADRAANRRLTDRRKVVKKETAQPIARPSGSSFRSSLNLFREDSASLAQRRIVVNEAVKPPLAKDGRLKQPRRDLNPDPRLREERTLSSLSYGAVRNHFTEIGINSQHIFSDISNSKIPRAEMRGGDRGGEGKGLENERLRSAADKISAAGRSDFLDPDGKRFVEVLLEDDIFCDALSVLIERKLSKTELRKLRGNHKKNRAFIFRLAKLAREILKGASSEEKLLEKRIPEKFRAWEGPARESYRFKTHSMETFSAGVMNQMIQDGFEYGRFLRDIEASLKLNEGQLMFLLTSFRNLNTPQAFVVFLEQFLKGQNIPPSVFEPFRSVFVRLRHYFDSGNALHADEAIEAAISHLAGRNQQYESLIGYINHHLEPETKNPRLRKVAGPGAQITNSNEIETVDLWLIKEGIFTLVFQLEVRIKGFEKPIRFAVNVPKDLTASREALERAYKALQGHYAWDPRYVMEPFGLGNGQIKLGDQEAEVPVMVSEWIEGDELHLYPESGAKHFHLWKGQREERDHPLPEKESLEIWRQIIFARTALTRQTPEGIIVPLTRVNGGDFVSYQDEDGWRVVLIWNQGVGEPVPGPPEAALINALILGEEDSVGDKRETFWVDQPDFSIQTVNEAYLESARYQAQKKEGSSAEEVESAVQEASSRLKALWVSAYEKTIPEILKMPESAIPDWERLEETPKREMLRVLDRAHHALEKYPSVTERISQVPVEVDQEREVVFKENAWTESRRHYAVGEGREAIRAALSYLFNHLLNAHVPKKEVTLFDIGAGEGFLGTLLDPEWIRRGRYLPYDLNPQFLGRIREKGLAKEFIQGDVYELSSKIQGAGVLISADAYDTFEDLERAVEETHKALRPGGKVLILQTLHVDPHPHFRGTYKDEFEKSGIVYNPKTDDYFRSEADLKRALDAQRAGDEEHRKTLRVNINLKVFLPRMKRALEKANFVVLEARPFGVQMFLPREERHRKVASLVIKGPSLLKRVNHFSWKHGTLEFGIADSYDEEGVAKPFPPGFVMEEAQILVFIAQKPSEPGKELTMGVVRAEVRGDEKKEIKRLPLLELFTRFWNQSAGEGKLPDDASETAIEIFKKIKGKTPDEIAALARRWDLRIASMNLLLLAERLGFPEASGIPSQKLEARKEIKRALGFLAKFAEAVEVRHQTPTPRRPRKAQGPAREPKLQTAPKVTQGPTQPGVRDQPLTGNIQLWVENFKSGGDEGQFRALEFLEGAAREKKLVPDDLDPLIEFIAGGQFNLFVESRLIGLIGLVGATKHRDFVIRKLRDYPLRGIRQSARAVTTLKVIAIETLGNLGGNFEEKLASCRVIAAYSGDRNPRVRKKTITALEKLGAFTGAQKEEFLPILFRLSGDDTGAVRTVAGKVASRLQISLPKEVIPIPARAEVRGGENTEKDMETSRSQPEIDTEVAERISSDVYLITEPLAWLIELSSWAYVLTDRNIKNFYEDWKKGFGRTGMFFVIEPYDYGQYFSGLITDLLSKFGESLPHAEWLRKHQVLIGEQIPFILKQFNVVIERTTALDNLMRDPGHLRYILAHEFFQRDLRERYGSSSTLQRFYNRLRKISLVFRFLWMSQYKSDFDSPEFWHEFFAQVFYLTLEIAGGSWQLDLSGETSHSNQVVKLRDEFITLRRIILKHFPFIESLKRESVDKANQTIALIQSVASRKQSTTGAPVEVNKDPSRRAEVRTEEIHTELNLKYFMKIRELLFGENKSTVVLVPAGGGDIATVLYLTDASRAVFADRLPFEAEGGKKVAKETSEEILSAYFRNLKKNTYGMGGNLRQMGELRPFVEETLRRMGATNLEIYSDNEKKEVWHVKFQWAYPGSPLKSREIVFVRMKDFYSSITEEMKSWLNWLSAERFDILIWKAGEVPPSDLQFSDAWIKQVIPLMNAGGLIVSDISLKGINRLSPIEVPDLDPLEDQGARFGYAAETDSKAGAYLYRIGPVGKPSAGVTAPQGGKGFERARRAEVRSAPLKELRRAYGSIEPEAGRKARGEVRVGFQKKRKLSPEQKEGYRKIALQLARKIIQDSNLQGGAVIVADGPSGAGKTTFTKDFLHPALLSVGARVGLEIINLDIFLKGAKERKELERIAVDKFLNRHQPSRDEFEQMWRVTEMNSFLEEVIDFITGRSPAGESQEFVVKKAFARGASSGQEMRSKSFRFEKGQIVLIDGKYALRSQALRRAGLPKRTLRIEAGKGQALKRVLDRMKSAGRPTQSQIRRGIVTNAFFWPSWQAYQDQTNWEIDFHVNLTSQDPEKWSVISRRAEVRGSVDDLIRKIAVSDPQLQGSVQREGTIFLSTPDEILGRIFQVLKDQLGGLEGKTFLSFGAGDLRDALKAEAQGMKVIAVEKSEDLVRQLTQKAFEEARRNGWGRDWRVHFGEDALDVSWAGVDAVYFFYTEPASAEPARDFRAGLERKLGEEAPHAVLAVLFTDPQIARRLDQFSHLASVLDRPEFISTKHGGLYLQLYRATRFATPRFTGEIPFHRSEVRGELKKETAGSTTRFSGLGATEPVADQVETRQRLSQQPVTVNPGERIAEDVGVEPNSLDGSSGSQPDPPTGTVASSADASHLSQGEITVGFHGSQPNFSLSATSNLKIASATVWPPHNETMKTGEMFFLRLKEEEVEALRDPEEAGTKEFFASLAVIAKRGERVVLAVLTPAEARFLNQRIDEFFLRTDTGLDRSLRSRIGARHDVSNRHYEAIFNAEKIWNRVKVITDREEAVSLAAGVERRGATGIQLIVSGGGNLGKRAEEIRASLLQKAGLLLISADGDFNRIFRTSGKSQMLIPTEEDLLVARQMLEAVALETFEKAA